MRPTSSMSTVRKHFCTVIERGAGGGSSWPRKYRFSGCIPAVVIRTLRSQSGGTSEPLGSCTCPLEAKWSRNRRRISWERIAAFYRAPAYRTANEDGATLRYVDDGDSVGKC